MIKKEIIDLVKKSVKKAQKNKDLSIFDIPEIHLEHPE